MAAVRAAVVAEVTDVGGGILVRSAAADAPLRIGCVLERRMALPGVVDAEDGPGWLIARAPQIAYLRVIPVDDEPRIGRKLVHGRPPPLGHALELAVTVELITEEVAKAACARAQPPCHLGQRRLVDLEEPELGFAGREQARCDAGYEVGARVVVGQPNLRAE